MKQLLIIIFCVLNTQLSAQTSKPFEGVVYAKTTFPGHPIQQLVSKIDVTKANVDEQYKAIRDQIAEAPGVKDDQMYMMALALMPVFYKTFITPQKTFTQLLSLGYEWQALLDNTEKKGRIFLQSHNMKERGTINFDVSELRKIWEKEDVGEYEGEYAVKPFSETVTIAGYPCKKLVYLFSGTSQGPVPTSKIISTIPWKVTVWYSDVVDPAINIQHPLYIKLNKGILKTEVEFDKEGKKKMVYEVTKIEPRKIEDDEMKIPELGEVVNHKSGGHEALMLVMKIMAEAGKVSWQ